jgi:tetratricopeptide (TPR) repeat protein
VHVDLAKAYFEQKGPSNWPERVTALLDRALALDPENAKAKFVYARFYFAEGTRDFERAEPYLRSARFDPTSLFMLAQVLSSSGSYLETLDVLERAIALHKDGPPYRVRLYAEALLELTRPDLAPKPNRRRLERARRQLCEYDRLFDDAARKGRNYQRVAEIYAAVCGTLNIQASERCFQRMVAAPQVPEPGPAAAKLPSAAAPAGGDPATT